MRQADADRDTEALADSAEAAVGLDGSRSHRLEECQRPLGGVSEQRRTVLRTAYEPTVEDLSVRATAIRTRWEADGFEVTTKQPPEVPAPNLYLTGDDGLRASVTYAVPKGDRPWQLVVTVTSGCYDPPDDS